jgi:hypothetical protein
MITKRKIIDNGKDFVSGLAYIRDSLTAALENLNDQILILGKDAIMGDKK